MGSTAFVSPRSNASRNARLFAVTPAAATHASFYRIASRRGRNVESDDILYFVATGIRYLPSAVRSSSIPFVIALVLAHGSAMAQWRDPNLPEKQKPGGQVNEDDKPKPEDDPALDPSAPPPAQEGFQLALRLGLALPFGDVASGDGNAIGDSLSHQYSFMVDIGFKIPNLFFGLYGGGGIGVGESKSLRYGIEALWFFAPAARWNPWAGYGIGYETATLRKDSNLTDASGLELAHLMAGVDARLHSIGIGPVFDFAIGRYTGFETTKKLVTDTTMHYWATLGVRFVVNP